MIIKVSRVCEVGRVTPCAPLRADPLTAQPKSERKQGLLRCIPRAHMLTAARPGAGQFAGEFIITEQNIRHTHPSVPGSHAATNAWLSASALFKTNGRPENKIVTTGAPLALGSWQSTRRHPRTHPDCVRSPFISAYGNSPITTMTASASFKSLASGEKMTCVSGETVWRIAARMVVPPL